MALNFSPQMAIQAQQNAEFMMEQQRQLAQQRLQGGPSATLPNGATVQCQQGQNLSVGADGAASCSTPQDTFQPSFQPPMLTPRFPGW